MKVKELFAPPGLSHSFSGTDAFLDQNNCIVVNRTKQDNAVLLHMRRESDGMEGNSYLRPQKDYAEISTQLLNWASEDPRIMGLTISELRELETGLKVSRFSGRMQVG